MNHSRIEPTSAASHWICASYGAPNAGSEVSRVTGYYRVSALTAFGAGPTASAAARAA